MKSLSSLTSAIVAATRKFDRRSSLFALLIVLIVLPPLEANCQLKAINSITTVAGTGVAGFSGDGGPGTSAMVSHPYGLANDAAGNLYIADPQGSRIRKVDTNGIITTLAGTGAFGFAGDGGPATSAVLNQPYSIAVDGAGNVYFNDQLNARIRKIAAGTGTISTVAGTGTPGDSTAGDGGPATGANIGPYGITVDAAGNLYISMIDRIRKVTASTGIISTAAGNGVGTDSGDGGPAINAGFSAALITLDTANNLYLGEGDRIRKVVLATGIITTVAGGGTTLGDGGPATSARIINAPGLATDRDGNIYLTQGGTIREINVGTGTINTIVGVQAKYGFSGDGGAAIAAGINSGNAISVDASGTIYFGDEGNDFNSPRVRKSFALATPATAIGSSSAAQTLFLQTAVSETISSLTIPASQGGKQEYTAGAVTGCVVDGATSIAAGTICSVPITFTPAYPGQRSVPLQVVTGSGNVNIGLNGLGNGPLAALTPGIISTVVGNGTYNQGGTGNGGPATSAGISVGYDVMVDYAGNIFFADGLCQIRKVTAATGIISMYAGNGICSFSGDGGQAVNASIEAISLALDSAGNLFLGDVHNVVREVNAATGIISTVAGNGTQGSSGDGGPATSAELYLPNGLLVDSGGNLFISSKFVVRRVAAATGIITTYAGNGTQGNSGDGGPAVAAEFKDPALLVFDPAGNLLILDTLAGTVRKVDANTGTITTVAGTGTLATKDLGDGGPATSAQFAYPTGLAADSAGDLYIVDNTGTLVRKVDAATGMINTVVGMVNNNGVPGYPNGVPATSVPLVRPSGAAMDGPGNLYVLNTATIRQVPASPSTLIFPTATPVGTPDTTDDPLSVTLYNIGNAPLTLTQPAAGTDPILSAAWSLDGPSTCPQITPTSTPFSVASGAGCTLAIDFTPTVAGTNSGTLMVIDNSLNASTSTQIVTLTGTGTGAAAATATLTPTTANFGSVQVGASASTPLTLTNTGTTTITITGVAIPSPLFTLSAQTCGTTLAAGASCTYTITYAPTATGAASSTFSVTDTAGTQSSTLSGTGLAAGTLTITPTTQAFPSIAVATTSAIQASTISNSTTQPIYLSSGSLTDSANFAQSDNCSGLIAAGGTCTVVFTFTPKTIGALTSSYSIHNLNAPASALSVTLSGTGTGAPVATLSPATLAFSATANAPASNQTVTLSNSGNAALSIASLTLGGTNPGSFSIVSQTCAATLAPNSSCTVTIGFTQTAVGTANATLIATDNASPAIQNVPLTGTVAGVASATLAPGALAFSTVAGTSSAAQALTSTNTGSAALAIGSISLAGSNPALFTQATTCGATLTAAASCTISVTFQPGAPGSFTATLSVTDNAATSPQTAILTGTARPAPAPQAALTPGSASFAAVVGTTSPAQIFTLTNAGYAVLPLTSVSITGSAFALTANNCGTSLAASASCTLGVAFTPAVVGTVTGTLTVVDSTGTQASALTGLGSSAVIPDFTLAATPAAQSSYRGQNVSYTLQLASLLAAAPFNKPVVLTATNLPVGVTASFSPATVLPGTSQATSVMTLSVPALLSRNAPKQDKTRSGDLYWSALLIGLACFQTRRHGARRLPSLAALMLLAGLTLGLTGCGTGNGFGVPTSTATITVLATSGATVHTTTVSLTIQ